MLVVAHREADHDGVEEGRLGKRCTARAKVRPDVEFEFVGTGGHVVARDEWLLGAPVLVGHGAGYQLALPGQCVQPHIHAGRRSPVRRIEHVCRHPSHRPSFATALIKQGLYADGTTAPTFRL